MAKKIRVIQYGIGPIGMKTVDYLTRRPSVEIVGAVDKDPDKIGRDLGEMAGLGFSLGVRVSGDALDLLRSTEADVVALTTSSSLERVKPQLLEIVSCGKNVVSSCEELVFPRLTQPAMFREIDEAAKSNGVSILSTGVNPGFLMDFLPLVMTGICRDVEKITVERIQDAQFRRIPFQKKIGAGLTPEQFEARLRDGSLRHVGLTESVHMIAWALGRELDSVEDVIGPVIAETRTTTRDLTVEPGQALGVSQIGRGIKDGKDIVKLLFRATVGEPDPRDRIVIDGTPDIDMTIRGGVNGDTATCAILVNALPVVVEAAPGLRTMADVRIIPCSG